MAPTARRHGRPIRYVNRAYSRSVLAGLYRSARVGLVTPLRDGMNLVAKEYIAAQDPDDPGVLILSRFAGAAAECTAALLVNPYDPETVATSIAHALSMPLEERRTRHEALFQVISENDLKSWGEGFLATLTKKAEVPRWHEQLGFRPWSAPALLDALACREAAMNCRLVYCVLPIAIVLGSEELFGADRTVRSAQAQTVAACMVNCDALITSCQNACTMSSTTPPAAPPTTVTPAPPGPPLPGASSQCLLNCTNHQLACKQACSEPPR